MRGAYTISTSTPASLAAADPLLQALRHALPAELQAMPMQRLPDKGLAHDHVRLVGTGWLARVPKQSQMQLAATVNLTYQRTCFDRASPAGHAPACLGVVAPDQHLTRGALLVQEIIGRPAHLPHDLAAMVQSLAALHRLPLPDEALRAPLWNAPDPLRALCDEIGVQAAYVAHPGVYIPSGTQAAIASGLQALQALCARAARPSRHLIAFDGHPGNFVVQDDGKAMLVDLEKCRYSYPGLDLAHATLYTSTTWDVDAHAVLSGQQVAQAYQTWEHAMGEAIAASCRAWHLPLRRAMWLWSLTWCAKWQALSGHAASPDADGEDWSATQSDPSLVAHVQERVRHYLSPEAVQHCLDEFTLLETL